MKYLRLLSLIGFCFVILSGLFGGENSVSNSISTEGVANSYYDIIKEKINCNVSHEELINIIDEIWDIEQLDPRIITIINQKVKELYGSYWPVDTMAHPAQNFYHIWNTKMAHPYRDNICKGDTEVVLNLTHDYMECGYTHPFKGVVTSKFGYRSGKMHNGIDIDLVVGDTVLSAFRGQVRVARWQGGYGRCVVVRHHNGLETLYGHLYKIFVKDGEYIDPGQPIGRGGNSGHSSGSHLHFETRFKGKPVNPENFIDFKTFTLKNDTLVLKRNKYGYNAFPPGVRYYKVKNGDFLYKIAHEQGVGIKTLCKWNGIKRNNFLVVGEKLRVSE